MGERRGAQAEFAGRQVAGGGPPGGRIWTPLTLNGFGGLAIAASFCLMILFAVIEESPAILAAFLGFAGVGFFLATRADRTAARIFLIVFGMETLAIAALYLDYMRIYGVPYLLGGSDELEFELTGALFARNFGVFDYAAIREYVVVPWYNAVGYVYIVGLLTKFGDVFGGAHTMVPRLFNAMCLGLIAVLVYRLAGKVGFARGRAVAVALAVAGFPLMMWVSGQTLRDVVVALVLVALVCLWQRDEGGSRGPALYKLLILSALLILVLVDLRIQQASVAALILLLGLLGHRRGGGRILLIIAIAPVIVMGVLAYLEFSSMMNTNRLNLVDQADFYSEYRVEEVGGGLSRVVFEAPLPLGLLLRAGYALVTPIPTVTSKPYMLWVYVGTVIQFLFLPFLFTGIYRAVRTPAWRLILCAFALLFGGMTMTSFQVRHIVQYAPFAVMLTFFGWERYGGSRRVAIILMALLGMLLSIFYVILKLT